MASLGTDLTDYQTVIPQLNGRPSTWTMSGALERWDDRFDHHVSDNQRLSFHVTLGLAEHGQATIFCGTEAFDIERGAIWMIAPGVAFRVIPRDGFCGRSITLTRPPDAPGADWSVQRRSRISRFWRSRHGEVDLTLRRILAVADSGSSVKAERLLDSLSHEQGYWPLRTQTSWRREVMQSVRIIEELAGKSVSLDSLASAVGLSTCRLSRIFTDEIGMPPYRYACNLRLMNAKCLILAGMSLASAALDAGFFDQSHFTRSFTRKFGYSPSRYVAKMSTSNEMAI